MLYQVNISGLDMTDFAGKGISDVVNLLIADYVFGFAGLILLLYLLASGFAMLTSAGNPEKMEAAKARLTNTIVGFFILFVAYWLVLAIGKITGLDTFGGVFQ